MGESFEPDRSHDMTEWENTIVTILSTPRFGRFRKCRKCGGEQAETAAGEGVWSELKVRCEADDEE